VAIVCPHCAAAVPAGINRSAGGMLRCNRCDTTWFARVHAGKSFANGSGKSPYLAVQRSGRPRFERIIEHDGAGGKPQSLAGGMAVGRRLFGSWLGVFAVVVLCASVAMLVIYSPVVGASPAVERLPFEGFQIRLIRAAIERAHGKNAVIVVGEIANTGEGDKAVPAVRIAVLADGAERHVWLHQPIETRLAAGEALTFRSLLASPPQGVDEVTFRLTERPNAVVGMH